MTKMMFTIRLLFLLSIFSITFADDESNTINKFTLEFYQKAANVDPGKNLITSPLSVQDVLSLLAFGARKNSQKEILDSLRINDLNSVKGRFKSIMTNMNSSQYDTKGGVLKFANKIYIADKPYIILNSNFKKTAIDVFSSDIEKVNFGKQQQTADIINRWVESRTNNKIKNFVDPNTLDPLTVVSLMNAIYFQGNWLNPFKTESVERGTFKKNGNQQVTVDMMYQKTRFNFARVPELDSKILSLPYKIQNTQMLIILPNEAEGLSELEKKITNIDVKTLKSKMHHLTVKTTIPKFKIESTLELKDLLKQLGIQEIFSRKSDLSGLLEGQSVPLQINYAMQKAFIEVNERGTEAAAVTDMRAAASSARIPLTEDFVADHPFMFLLLNDNDILFCGRYVGA